MAERPGNLTGGTLDRTSPIDLFRTLYVERTTAQVMLSRRAEERTFWFDRGQLLSAASNREAQLVGELLRTFGLADETVLFAAFERALAEPGRGLAKALTETGAVPQFVADACVRALAERVLYDTFGWRDGVFTITPLDKPPDLPVKFDKSNGSLVLEGLRRLPTDAPFPGPQPDPRARPALANDLTLRYQWIVVTTEEADVLARVDASHSAADVSADLRILARLASVGLIHLIPVGRNVDRGMEGPVYLNVEVADAAPPARAAEVAEVQVKLVANTYRRIDWVSLYDVVGVPKEATIEELHRAVHERARLFHPDQHLKAHMAGQREALESLFKKVKHAEVMFKTADNRAEYDRSLERGQQGMFLQSTGASPEVQIQMARANYLRARTLFEQEDYYPAYEMVKQSVEFDSSKPEYWILLSRCQRKNPKWVRQSTETMRRATARMPESAELWFELAEACQAERNEPERVKSLKEVLRLDPANRRAQSALAEIAAMKPSK